MKSLFILVLGLCLSFPAHASNRNTTSIQIIMDDSGVLMQDELADQYKMHLLRELKKLVRKRNYAHAQIDVISSSVGRTIWSGTPSDLKRKPEHALALVEAIKTQKENCNNLPGAFGELQSNLSALKRRGFKRVYVIVFSSLIDTPRPCNEKTSIKLPQPPPVSVDINGVLTSSELVRSIHFYWVSPHQKNIWEEFLLPAFNWSKSHNVVMDLLDIERSKFALERGLEFKEAQK